MSVEMLDKCQWCLKRGRASEWEQFSTCRDHGWMRPCVRCANRRLVNPFNVLLQMRNVETREEPCGT